MQIESIQIQPPLNHSPGCWSVSSFPDPQATINSKKPNKICLNLSDCRWIHTNLWIILQAAGAPPCPLTHNKPQQESLWIYLYPSKWGWIHTNQSTCAGVPPGSLTQNKPSRNPSESILVRPNADESVQILPPLNLSESVKVRMNPYESTHLWIILQAAGASPCPLTRHGLHLLLQGSHFYKTEKEYKS